MTTGERIRKQRIELGLSVEEIAKRLGKNKATIYRYENNYIENMPISVLESLAEILKTTPDYLIGWDSPPSIDTILLDNLYNFFQHHPLEIRIKNTYSKFYADDICKISKNDKMYHNINTFFQDNLEITLEELKAILNKKRLPTAKQLANIITMIEIPIEELLHLPNSPYWMVKDSFIKASLLKKGYFYITHFTHGSTEKGLLVLNDSNDFHNFYEIDINLYNAFTHALDNFVSSQIDQLISKSKRTFVTDGEYTPSAPKDL